MAPAGSHGVPTGEGDSMLFGIGLPQRDGLDLRKDLTDLCLGAEGEGFSSLWVYDRLLFPTNPVNGLYGVDGLPWIEAYQQAADSLAVLAAPATADRQSPGDHRSHQRRRPPRGRAGQRLVG